MSILIKLPRNSKRKHKKMKTSVFELLQKPEAEFGAGLQLRQAEVICWIFDIPRRPSTEWLTGLTKLARKIAQVKGRIDLRALLEETTVGAESAWDRLLAIPVNVDKTRRDGGRPANIGWALDDILHVLSQSGKQ